MIYKDTDIGRSGVVEAVAIHCIDTFEKKNNNKFFSVEDDIIRFYIFNSILKSRGAADTLGDLYIAGT